MQIPAIAEQTQAEPSLFGLEWGFGANGDFSLVLSDFFFSGGCSESRRYNKSKATITKKILWATEEAVATITVREIFSFRGLTNKEINVII